MHGNVFFAVPVLPVYMTRTGVCIRTGLRDLCLECMQYQAEDRIDRTELSEWLAELHAQAEQEAMNALGK